MPRTTPQATAESASWANLNQHLLPHGPRGQRVYDILKRRAASPAAVYAASADKLGDWLGPDAGDWLHRLLHDASTHAGGTTQGIAAQGTSASSQAVRSQDTSKPIEAPEAATVEAIKLASLVLHDLEEELADWPKRSRHVAAVTAIERALIDGLAERGSLVNGQGLVTVAVIGEFSSGKSTFINAILGQALCPVDPAPTTSSITSFTYGPKLRIEKEEASGKRVVITATEYAHLVKHPAVGGAANAGAGTLRFHVESPSHILAQIRLLDTPGFDNPSNNLDTKVTEDALLSADVVFALFDINKGSLTSSLLSRLRDIQSKPAISANRPLWLIVNKAATKRSSADRKLVLDRARAEYKELFSQFLLVDSLILADPKEQQATEALARLAESSARAVRSRNAFSTQLAGAKVTLEASGRAVYRVTTDGQHVDLSSTPYPDLAAREDILQLLTSAMDRRRELLAARASGTAKEVARQWRSALTALQDDLRALQAERGRPGADTNPHAWVIEAKSATVESVTDEICEVLSDGLLHGILTGCRVDDAGFFRYEYYYVGYRTDYFIPIISEESKWAAAANAMKSYKDTLANRAGVTLSATDPKLFTDIVRRRAPELRDKLGDFLEGCGFDSSLRLEFEDDSVTRDHHEALLREKLGLLSDYLARWIMKVDLEPAIDKDTSSALLRLGERAGVQSENAAAVTLLLGKVQKALEVRL
jgi:hypothetical protein